MSRSPKKKSRGDSDRNLPEISPLESRRISCFKSATSKLPDRTATLREIFTQIETGKLPIQQKIRDLQEQWLAAKQRYGEKSDQAKAIYKKKQALKEKSWLPAFSLSALFNGKRANENVAEHSGLLQIDIDHLESHAEWNRVCKALQRSPHIWKLWRSISGDGIKAAMVIPPSVESHKAAFKAAAAHVHELTGKAIDEACKDPARICFFSKGKVWTNAKAFPIEPTAGVSKNGSTPTPTDAEPLKQSVREVAESLLGPLGEWQLDERHRWFAYCRCPDVTCEHHNEENPNTRVYLNPGSTPRIECRHGECAPVVKGRNDILRKLFFERKASDVAAADREAWLGILETCIVTGEKLRSVKLPKRELLLGNFFAEGDCGFVFAPRGAGKTWCGMGMASAMSLGGQFGKWKAHKAVKVFYVDGEMPSDDTQARINGLLGDNENLDLLHHEFLFQHTTDVTKSTMNLTNPAFRQAVTDYCVKGNCKVLFLDNLSSLAFGMREDKADDWEMLLPWLLDLRRRKIAVIIIHHAGRSGKMRGTTKREDAVAWIIGLEDRRGTADDKRGARFISYFDKPSRNTQEETPPYEWHIITEPDGRVTVGCEQSEYDCDAAKGTGRRKKVSDEQLLGLLRPRPLSDKEWQQRAEGIGMPEGTFRNRVSNLRRCGKAEKTPDGTWTLPNEDNAF
jgi:AAA domain/BT4734-like, N-terminal domain